MSAGTVPGRSAISRRALVDLVRPAVAGSYGVTGFRSRSLLEAVMGRLGLVDPGIRISVRSGIQIDLYLNVAFGLPVAEVARQADSAVRYTIRRALGREVARLTVHVGGMTYAGDGRQVRSTGEPEPTSIVEAGAPGADAA